MRHLQEPGSGLSLPGDRRGLAANDAVKLYCIIRTAKEGNHASCSAERDAKAAWAWRRSIITTVLPSRLQVASDPRVQGLVDRIARDQEAFDKPQEGKAPKTMYELGGRAVSASRQGLRNARSRLGGSSEADEPVPLTSAPPPHPTENQPADENLPVVESLPAVSEDMRPPQPRAACGHRGRRFRPQELSLHDLAVPQVPRRDG